MSAAPRQTPSDDRGGGKAAPAVPRPVGAGPPAGGGMLRSAGTVGLLTLLSRVFGYLRDMVVAGLLGTGTVADAWQAAFEIPNTLRRLASEGNLSAAFVPVFSGVERQGDEARTWRLAARFHTAVAVTVAALTVIGILIAPAVVPLLYPGYADVPGKLALTVQLTRMVFVYALFISLSAVLMAVLNARDRFAAAAFTPVLLNIAILAGGVTAWMAGVEAPVYFILAGAVLGGLLQWLFLVPFARAEGMRFGPRLDWADPELREIGQLIVPRLFGVGVVQVNILVGRMLASELGEGNVAALYFGSRITELTLGVFAISIATVVLPPLSRQGAAGDRDGMRSTLAFALRQVTAITLPATVALIVLREPIVRVLFERGRFDAESTAITAAGLAGYAFGLVGVAGVRIIAPGFFALRDTRTPVRVATAAMFVNIVGCLALRGPLQIAGISLANSIAGTFSAVALLWLLRRRLGRLDGRALLASLVRIVAAAGAMGAVLAALQPTLAAPGRTGVEGALGLGGLVIAGIVVYFGVLSMLRAPELEELRQVVRRRIPADPGADDDGGRP